MRGTRRTGSVRRRPLSGHGGGLLVSLVVLLVVLHTCVASLREAAAVPTFDPAADVAVVNKCCGPGQVVVFNPSSTDLVVVNRSSTDLCRPVSNGTAPWTPQFTASHEDEPTAGYRTLPASSVPYKLAFGFPKCKDRQERLVYNSLLDRLVLYPNGKLRHYVIKHQPGNEDQQQGDFIVDHELSFDYEQGFYCLDKVIDTDGPDAQVAVICTPEITWTDTDSVMRRIVNPACHAISVACLLLVAIIHFVLPQLRDLIGNMVTTLAGCMIVARIAHIVRIFVEFHSSLSYLTADAILYISTLGSFFWLLAMGYYIWRTFKSRNVFLRITDGRKYCYYSLYVWGCTLIMGGMALFAHLILDARDNINRNYASHQSTTVEGAIGWLGIAVISVTVMCTILVNLFFYFSTKTVIKRMSTYGQIHHKMKYSFIMFSKLFAIMIVDLTLFFLTFTQQDVIFYAHIIFNPIQAVLVLYVTVIQPKRVKFLLRKACCYEKCISPCCRPKDTDTQAGVEWGEEMLAFNTADY